MPGEPSLIDTNVLVYSLFQDSPHHAASRGLIEQAQEADANFFVATQSLAEFYAIVTNAKRVSAPREPLDVIGAIEEFLGLPGLSLIPQPADVVERRCELLRERPVKGGDVFDLQLIATMLAARIRRIHTFNGADFEVFSQVEVLLPTARSIGGIPIRRAAAL